MESQPEMTRISSSAARSTRPRAFGGLVAITRPSSSGALTVTSCSPGLRWRWSIQAAVDEDGCLERFVGLEIADGELQTYGPAAEQQPVPRRTTRVGAAQQGSVGWPAERPGAKESVSAHVFSATCSGVRRPASASLAAPRSAFGYGEQPSSWRRLSSSSSPDRGCRAETAWRSPVPGRGGHRRSCTRRRSCQLCCTAPRDR